MKAVWSVEESFYTSAGTVACGRSGDGQDIVLAHGWPWSSFSWHRVIPELAERYRVHWYDMPGYGKSDKRSYQRTSLDVQGRYSPRCCKTGVCPDQSLSHTILGVRLRLEHINNLQGDDVARLAEPWLTEEGSSSFYQQFAQADEKYTAEIESKYGEVSCPTKIIWGEDDPWISLDRGRSLLALMPSAEFETLPGVGHLPQLEAPREVLRKLTAFI